MRTLSVVLLSGLVLGLVPGTAAAGPDPHPAKVSSAVHRDRPVNPIADEERALRTKAMEQTLGTTAPLARGRAPKVGR
ncbi:hypothetical protein ACFWY5_48985 [Nonomuraea sp. NPDC059007]